MDVQGRTVQDVGDGSIIITVTSSATAMTAPFFAQSGGFAWRVKPDGRVARLGP